MIARITGVGACHFFAALRAALYQSGRSSTKEQALSMSRGGVEEPEQADRPRSRAAALNAMGRAALIIARNDKLSCFENKALKNEGNQLGSNTRNTIGMRGTASAVEIITKRATSAAPASNLSASR